MNNNILISIIVISYNSSKTIIETLNSVYNQTYKNLELILADDASTDDTVSLVVKWCEIHKTRFSNVVYSFSNINQGISKNCNNGLKLANGDYIRIIAGDDRFKREAMSIELYNCLKYPDDCLVFGVELIGDSVACNYMQTWIERGLKILKQSKNNQYKNLLIDNYISGPARGLMSKDVFEKIGYFDERYKMMEDYPFLVKLQINGYSFRYIDDVTVEYRISTSSTCQAAGITAFRISMDDFFKFEKGKLLLRNGMYYIYLCQKLESIRFNIKKTNGSKSIKYKLSFFIYIIRPIYFIKTILNKIKFKNEVEYE